jgi:hypothetical protein
MSQQISARHQDIPEKVRMVWLAIPSIVAHIGKSMDSTMWRMLTSWRSAVVGHE